MLIRRRRGWEIPESRVTPEAVVMNRRAVNRRAVLAAGAVGAGLLASPAAQAQWFSPSRLLGGATKEKPRAKLAAERNTKYVPGRDLSPESDATSYNNYYEFGLSKSVVGPAQELVVDPWKIEIDGMVKTPRSIGFAELMRQVKLEERIYRHRCVEAWAMTVPWTGFPLSELVKLAEPLGSAKYMVMQTLADKKTMPGLRQAFYPWPYTEGVTMEEAVNELSFISVGMYGKTLPPQNGAPLRLTLPWKYGFKSVKSIVKVSFTDKRPVSFWEALQDSEYGFWANVNPAVPHPRWSQARERLLGSDEMVPTVIWNGYGEFVAGMYADKKNERLFA
jgi:sulfoxide reductase catalytic subunit YedY